MPSRQVISWRRQALLRAVAVVSFVHSVHAAANSVGALGILGALVRTKRIAATHNGALDATPDDQ